MLRLLEMRAGCWIVTWRRSVLVAALASALGFSITRSSWGLCAPQEQGLLWSYPANGSVGIPVDADLFVNGELSGVPTLAGEPLPRIATGVYDLGVLVPRTLYEVRWNDAAITFTTGDSAAPLPREPSSDVLVTRNPSDFTRCPLVLPQGCFDTGQRTWVRFDVGPAMAWLLDVVSCDGRVRTMVWPSGCGAPVVESEDRILCISARTTSGAGLSSSTGVICSAPDVPPGTVPQSSGCQEPWPPDSVLTLLADNNVTLGSMSGPAAPSSIAEGPGDSSAVERSRQDSRGGCTVVAPRSDRAVGGFERLAAAGMAALLVLLRRRPRE
jgi:hypothetical protein